MSDRLDASATRTRRFALASVAVVGLVVLLAATIGRAGPTSATSSAAGPAPGFSAATLDGSSTVQLSALRGHPVVLNFFASWCTACREEAATLDAAYRRWRGRGVAFIGIAYQDVPEDAASFASRTGVRYPVTSDVGATIAAEYGVAGVPETVVVSADGQIVAHTFGAVGASDLDRWLRLAEGPA